MSHDEELERAMHKIGALRYELELLQSENRLVREESDRHYQLWVDSQAEVEHLQNCLGDAHAINAKEELKTWERIENLKAEVERLRKAGDAMANAIKWLPQSISDHHQDAWNAAKEGKQS